MRLLWHIHGVICSSLITTWYYMCPSWYIQITPDQVRFIQFLVWATWYHNWDPFTVIWRTALCTLYIVHTSCAGGVIAPDPELWLIRVRGWCLHHIITGLSLRLSPPSLQYQSSLHCPDTPGEPAKDYNAICFLSAKERYFCNETSKACWRHHLGITILNSLSGLCLLEFLSFCLFFFFIFSCCLFVSFI